MIARVATSMAVASGVTFGLFLVMHTLVAGDGEVNIDEQERRRFVDVVQDIEDQPPQRLERQVEKPPEVEAPPPEIDTPQVDMSGPDKLNLSIGRANTGLALILVRLILVQVQTVTICRWCVYNHNILAGPTNAVLRAL